MEKKDLKIALVHDFLLYPGGAEQVLKVLSEMYPKAPIYTLLCSEDMRKSFENRDIEPSYLQKFPKFLKKHYQWLLPFFPVIPETFDFREYDLVISSSGAWSKSIVTKLDTKHIAYIHSPMRFVWDYNEKYLQEINKKPSLFKRSVFNYLRIWDRVAAERPDYLIANSKYTQNRISKYYRRDSEVIYPPVIMCHSERSVSEVEESEPRSLDKLEMTKKNYFLIVSRLSPYKKVDIAVEAFNKLGLPLVVIGQGKQEKYLRKIAEANVKILSWQNEDIVQNYYKNARAFIFPCEDDFGIAPVEAMLNGVPVIAYRKGGALETIIEGQTGEFFDVQTPEILADGVRRFMLNENRYDRNVIVNKGKEFSRERFEREIGEYIKKVINDK